MIIVDVETTGIDPKKHSIASIGAVDFFNSNQFYRECRIFDGAEITQRALEINGFSEKQLKDINKYPLEKIILEFIWWTNWRQEITLAGENPSFDRDFLKASAERYNIAYNPGYRTIDLHTSCYSNYLRRGISPPIKNGRTDLDTDKIFNYVGLSSEPKPHHALTGAKMEAEAFSRLIYGKNLLGEFGEFQIPSYLLQ